MTYNVFSGTLNPTQSINLLGALEKHLLTCLLTVSVQKFHYASWFGAGSKPNSITL